MLPDTEYLKYPFFLILLRNLYTMPQTVLEDQHKHKVLCEVNSTLFMRQFSLTNRLDIVRHTMIPYNMFIF